VKNYASEREVRRAQFGFRVDRIDPHQRPGHHFGGSRMIHPGFFAAGGHHVDHEILLVAVGWYDDRALHFPESYQTNCGCAHCVAQSLVEILSVACRIDRWNDLTNDRLHVDRRFVSVTGVDALRHDRVSRFRQSLVRCDVYPDGDCRSVDCRPGLYLIFACAVDQRKNLRGRLLSIGGNLECGWRLYVCWFVNSIQQMLIRRSECRDR